MKGQAEIRLRDQVDFLHCCGLREKKNKMEMRTMNQILFQMSHPVSLALTLSLSPFLFMFCDSITLHKSIIHSKAASMMP